MDDTPYSQQTTMTVEVIIPVKDRVEIIQCVRSLLFLEQVLQIWICDAGSVQPDCVAALHELKQCDQVRLLQFPMAGFNKSHLLNQGILHTTSEYLLVSDADILWHFDTLQALVTKVSTQTHTICCVGNVQESDPMSVALKRDRYIYQLTTNSDTAWIEILPANLSNPQTRPGCGLICAQKATLQKLGGYRECFQGWGWEDQDLLIRAEIMGIQVEFAGSVIHLSHADAQRNQHFHHINPSDSRNQNILTCLNQLATGNLFGDLPLAFLPEIQHRTVQIRIPEALSKNQSGLKFKQ